MAVPTGISEPAILAEKSTPASLIVNVLPERVNEPMVPLFVLPLLPAVATAYTLDTLPYTSTVITGVYVVLPYVPATTLV